MSTESGDGKVGHYDAQYENFSETLLADIRQEAFGEDIGQTGWLTVPEQDLFIKKLGLDGGSHLLDVACGSGEPTLRIAAQAGCRVTGVDLHQQAVDNARRNAAAGGLADRSDFRQADGSQPLPFGDGSFDTVMCIDAINHLSDRVQVLAEWHRILKTGGRVLFTDPIVVTGALTNEEIRIRSSIGFFLYVPPGLNETLLADAGFTVDLVQDRTPAVAANARGWLEARRRRERELRRLEGDESYDGQQEFFETAASLAEEGRLSRYAYVARAD